MIAALTAIAALAIVLHDRRQRALQNPVTRKSRNRRQTRTWDALANDSTTAGDNDRTVYFAPLASGSASRANAELTGPWWRVQN